VVDAGAGTCSSAPVAATWRNLTYTDYHYHHHHQECQSANKDYYHRAGAGTRLSAPVAACATFAPAAAARRNLTYTGYHHHQECQSANKDH
jgi:hypothetical protein